MRRGFTQHSGGQFWVQSYAERLGMKILALGSNCVHLTQDLADHDVWYTDQVVEVDSVKQFAPDLVVSFGYRHLLPASILKAVSNRALNIHISLLPWNRGADPNFWSWLTDTPKGVSIHWMTEELDRGELFAQNELHLSNTHTLRSSYSVLVRTAAELFSDTWQSAVDSHPKRCPQLPGGSYHSLEQGQSHLQNFPQGWDTECMVIEQYGKEAGLWKIHSN